MGYDGGIIIEKKKAIEKVKHLLIAYSFSDLYKNYLYMWEYPENYDIPKDEASIVADWFSEDIFEKYFIKKPLENDEARIVTKDIYEDFVKWIENKVKTTTLYDIATKRLNDNMAHTYIDAYNSLKDLKIDWDTEYVVFRNDW